jgi:hypothetical protein
VGCGIGYCPDPLFFVDYRYQSNRVKDFCSMDEPDIIKLLDSERGFSMQAKHWLGVVVLLAVGYYVGLKYPNFYKGQFS